MVQLCLQEKKVTLEDIPVYIASCTYHTLQLMLGTCQRCIVPTLEFLSWQGSTDLYLESEIKYKHLVSVH